LTANDKIILCFGMAIARSHDVWLGIEQIDAFAADS
jgi:hypothetical protein